MLLKIIYSQDTYRRVVGLVLNKIVFEYIMLFAVCCSGSNPAWGSEKVGSDLEVGCGLLGYSSFLHYQQVAR